MALEEFWRNVKVGAYSLGPSVLSHAAPSAPTSRTLQLDLWLTPAVVDGFDPKDFSFLPAEERKELEETVRAFREVAEEIPSDQPATKAQVERARPLFETLIRTLGIDRYSDPIEYKVARILERFKPKLAQAAPWIVDFESKVETDFFESGSEEAVWIWVIVQDAFADSPDFFEAAEMLRKTLEELLGIHGITQWIHVRFRSVSEQEEEVSPESS